MRSFVILCLALAAAPASAQSSTTRNYTVTGFDRLRIEGPYAVTLRTGPAPSARARGPARAIDRLSVAVQGGVLVIRPDAAGWGGYPGQDDGPVTVAVTVPSLMAAALAGSGALTIDRVRGARLDLALAGSGDIAVGLVAVERLTLSVGGSGDVALAGRAADVRIMVRGAGDVAAEHLVAGDAEVTAAGSGDIGLTATRTAKVTSAGSGEVTILGRPACTVHASGVGAVACGTAKR